MANAAEHHPFHALLVDASPGMTQIFGAFENLLAAVQRAAPNRWKSKRKNFCHLRTEQQLLEMRSELVMAAKLARAGASFAFGNPKVPNPDLVLDNGLGIEVTARLSKEFNISTNRSTMRCGTSLAAP